jgi:hypothetical protein
MAHEWGNERSFSMYMLFEYITYLAVVFVVGASLFVASALVLFVKEMLAKAQRALAEQPWRPFPFAEAPYIT